MQQISSCNKKILIVGDVHQDIARLKRIIKHEAPDITVCTGDWYDSFTYDTTKAVEDTTRFLLDNLDNKQFVTCVGNHDLPYLYNNQYTYCSGFELEKRKLILKLVGNSWVAFCKKFQWGVWIDDYLMTHAGLAQDHLPAVFDLRPAVFDLSKKSISKFLDNQGKIADELLPAHVSHWFYRAGAARTNGESAQKLGGITWLDWDQEFKPIDGLNQIVGHSQGRRIRSLIDGLSSNYCIDCGMFEYFVRQNKEMESKYVVDI